MFVLYQLSLDPYQAKSNVGNHNEDMNVVGVRHLLRTTPSMFVSAPGPESGDMAFCKTGLFFTALVGSCLSFSALCQLLLDSYYFLSVLSPALVGSSPFLVYSFPAPEGSLPFLIRSLAHVGFLPFHVRPPNIQLFFCL